MEGQERLSFKICFATCLLLHMLWGLYMSLYVLSHLTVPAIYDITNTLPINGYLDDLLASIQSYLINVDYMPSGKST